MNSKNADSRLLLPLAQQSPTDKKMEFHVTGVEEGSVSVYLYRRHKG